jgi:NinB protein
MTESRSIVLANPKQAHAALLDLWRWLQPLVADGKRFVLSLRLETRSSAQNRLLHSRLSDVAKQVPWAGKRRSAETWKRLAMAAWLRARGEHVEILPALDGHGVDIVFERTSNLNRAECAELSDWILAWGDDQGVVWSPPSLGRDWPDESTKKEPNEETQSPA